MHVGDGMKVDERIVMKLRFCKDWNERHPGDAIEHIVKENIRELEELQQGRYELALTSDNGDIRAMAKEKKNEKNKAGRKQE